MSVVCALGEIVYAGSATALVPHLAPAHAPGHTLAPLGPAALWGTLATATLLSALAVATARRPEKWGRKGRPKPNPALDVMRVGDRPAKECVRWDFS